MSLSYISVREFKISDLDQNTIDETLNYLLERSTESLEDELHNNRITNFDELLKVWFTIGVVGFKKSSSLTIYTSFDKQELDITDLKKTFQIHPLFYRY